MNCNNPHHIHLRAIIGALALVAYGLFWLYVFKK
jgi:hypothetical protein